MNNSKQDYFIDTEGNLIKITGEMSIDEFSENYWKMINLDLDKIYETIQKLKPQYAKKELTPKELVVELLGYVLYSYNNGELNIIIPHYDINYKEINCTQIDKILRLLNIDNQPKHILNRLFFLEELKSYEETCEEMRKSAKKYIKNKYYE